MSPLEKQNVKVSSLRKLFFRKNGPIRGVVPSRACACSMASNVVREQPGDELLTSGLWNRRRDLRAVRRHLGVAFGGVGDSDVEISCARTKVMLSRGYTRVLLGDHGPYFELRPHAVMWENLTKVHAGEGRFYDEWRVGGGIEDRETETEEPETTETISRSRHHTAKLYHQLKPVIGQRNPPRDSAWAVANNRHETEGYAGYLVGEVYVGAFDVCVNGKTMPQLTEKTKNKKLAGRVAWWRPVDGCGGIIVEGVTGIRNEGIDSSQAAKQGEIQVYKKDLTGVDCLVPGEGVWFEVEDEEIIEKKNDSSQTKTTVRKAVKVTGPGFEPLRYACPGYKEADAEVKARAKALSKENARLKQGKRTGTPAAMANLRAKITPWNTRSEVERVATATAMRRVGRILRENCARIAREKELLREKDEMESLSQERQATTENRLPKWLTAIGRGAVVCAVDDSVCGEVETVARSLADKIILASPLYRGRSVSTVELTTDGLTGLRQKGFEVVEVKEQVKEDIQAQGEVKIEKSEKEVTQALRAFDDVLPRAGVGDGPLVVVLPVPMASTSGLGHRATLALRASTRVIAVVLVSPGPDVSVKDIVALSGACTVGTEAFAPVVSRAVAPLELITQERNSNGKDSDGSQQNLTALTLTLLERGDFGDAVNLATSGGRAYCWQCGDTGHSKSACSRRGEKDVADVSAAMETMAVK